MTSLAYICTMKKTINIIFGRKVFICEPIFKFLCHFLILLECKRMTLDYILLEMFQNTLICEKEVSKGWCKESKQACPGTACHS